MKDEIEVKLHRMNKRRFIIELIVFGISTLATGYGYMYIWSLGPFKDSDISNISVTQALIIHILFVFSLTFFNGNLISYCMYELPAIGAVFEYDLEYGKYSKKK